MTPKSLRFAHRPGEEGEEAHLPVQETWMRAAEKAKLLIKTLWDHAKWERVLGPEPRQWEGAKW